MSLLDLDFDNFLLPPMVQPKLALFSQVRTPMQRKSSNFFPVQTPRDIDDSFDHTLLADPGAIAPPYAKRHNSSPLIGSFNNRTGQSSLSSSSLKFFYANPGSGSGNPQLLTPLFADVSNSTPNSAPASVAPTSAGTNGRQTLSVFGGIDIGADLSNNLHSLNLNNNINNMLSPPPSAASTYNYQQSTPQQTGGSLGLLAISSPPNTASMLNLGGGGSTTATTSGSVTPSISSNSIWNDSNSLGHFGLNGNGNSNSNNSNSNNSNNKNPNNIGVNVNSNILNSTPKLSTLDELFDGEHKFSMENSYSDVFSNDMLFSPFYAHEGHSQNQFGEISSPLAPVARTASFTSSGSRPNFKSKENIYLSKLNTPSFVPSAVMSDGAKVMGSSTIEPTDSEVKLENTRAFINQIHSNANVNSGASSSSGHRGNLVFNNDSATLTSKLNQIERKESEISGRISRKNSGLPSFNITQVNSGIDRGNVRVSLPQTSSLQKQVTRNDVFIREILTTDETTKYSEDYCSTFYKRNSHGYMFTKEPTNTLKVNTTANKSWVQLKIKLPCSSPGQTRGRTDAPALLIKKLKVDVRHLPIWRPITMNGGASSYQGNGYSNSNYQGGKRYGNSNYNGYGNGSRRYSGGSGASGFGNNKEFRKPKNLNVSKRFGKKTSE